MNNKKIPLTSQTQKLFIVIRKNKKYPLSLVKDYCDTYFDRYAFIEHLADVEPITGLIEGCHYHIVAHVREKGVSKDTHLNNIKRHFRMTDKNGIEIDQLTNEVLAIQYLLHKNNKEKTKHEPSEIQSNIDKDELNMILSSESGESISFDLIFSLCLSNKNISGVIKALGITNFRLYRNVVWDIWNDLKSERTKKAQLEKELIYDKAL